MMVRSFLIILILISRFSFSLDFSRIDSIVQSGISNRIFPCAQLLIGLDNDILYEKSYGRLTYDENSEELKHHHLFDIASLTKVVATTTAIMLLYERNLISLDDKVIKYIPEFDNNGKSKITIRHLLLHNSGLKAWIPFYKYYGTKEDALNAIHRINLEYSPGSKFIYSDLNAILLGLIVEKVTGKSLDVFCNYEIFSKLGMDETGFNPNDNMKNFCVPTEHDSYWRFKLLQGEVHDEAAYLFGGVAGNAGLFSNARDLYDFSRMMLNKGFYYNPYTRGLKEERLFKEETIDLFTSKVTGLPYKNSRALGWDTKPEPNQYSPQCGDLFSENCFGHTGYTGTSIWCDKDRNLIIIFLTNRVHPNRGNEGIKDIRPDLHDEIVKLTTK